MINKLDAILAHKDAEVTALTQRVANTHDHRYLDLLQGKVNIQRQYFFRNALKSTSLAIIAEIKRKSPSKGIIAPIENPVHLAQQYILGGANALSILTDQPFFGGHLNDLIEVSQQPFTKKTPILRKDFIIDPIQIVEAFLAGANAVLCIIAAVGKRAESLIAFAHSLGLDVLVEVHNLDEIQIAIDCGADIIGINNRNLKTLKVDAATCLELINHIPNSIMKVAESGIENPSLAQTYYRAGFDAVLIGEALVKSSDPLVFMDACRDE